MSILLLVLLIGLFLHASMAHTPVVADLAAITSGHFSALTVITLVLAPKFLAAGLYHLLARHTLGRLGNDPQPQSVRTLDRVAHWCGRIIVTSFLLDLFQLGAPIRLRELTGDLPLVDELIILAPALAAVAYMWFAHYPIDRRLRAATFLKRVQEGRPAEVMTRTQFMVYNIRHQWAMVGLPALFMLLWLDMVNLIVDPHASDATIGLVTFIGAITIFAFAPAMMRRVLDTIALPAGDLRDTLAALCAEYRVKVRELLLWRTHGNMVNGAVVGAFAPQRYIMLTDALLEQTPARHIEAVMAHELAHVRKHHMIWLLIITAVAAGIAQILATPLMAWLLKVFAAKYAGKSASLDAALSHRESPMFAASALSVVAWLLAFTWVSRRFERQADSYAVQHLARRWHADHAAGNPWPVVQPTPTPQPTTPVISAPGSDSPAALPLLPTATELTAALERNEVPAHLPSAPIPTPTSAPATATATAPSAPHSPDLIPQPAAELMAQALQSVADLNHIPTDRGGWRHDSIAFRQRLLRAMTGTPIDDTVIDRHVARIKFAGLLLLAGLLAFEVWRSYA